MKSQTSRRRTKRWAARLATIALVAVPGVGLLDSPADAAFSSCVLGGSGVGESCLWTSSPYVGNPSLRVKSTAAGLSVNARSYGNRITSRCAVFYRTSGSVAATAGPNTGNSWSSTRTIGFIDISVC